MRPDSLGSGSHYAAAIASAASASSTRKIPAAPEYRMGLRNRRASRASQAKSGCRFSAANDVDHTYQSSPRKIFEVDAGLDCFLALVLLQGCGRMQQQRTPVVRLPRPIFFSCHAPKDQFDMRLLIPQRSHEYTRAPPRSPRRRSASEPPFAQAFNSTNTGAHQLHHWARGDAKFRFDSESIQVPGTEPERSPVLQAKAQALCLADRNGGSSRCAQNRSRSACAAQSI